MLKTLQVWVRTTPPDVLDEKIESSIKGSTFLRLVFFCVSHIHRNMLSMCFIDYIFGGFVGKLELPQSMICHLRSIYVSLIHRNMLSVNSNASLIDGFQLSKSLTDGPCTDSVRYRDYCINALYRGFKNIILCNFFKSQKIS